MAGREYPSLVGGTHALLMKKKSHPLLLPIKALKTEHIEKIALAIFTLFA
jgi:hypothetical protein